MISSLYSLDLAGKLTTVFSSYDGSTPIVVIAAAKAASASNFLTVVLKSTVAVFPSTVADAVNTTSVFASNGL